MKTLYTITIFLITISLVKAENTDDKLNFSVGADFVSSYIWRATYQAGSSIQPGMEFGIGNFSLSAWGSVDVSNIGFKEVDFMISYSIADFRLTLTDYWWMGEDTHKYFTYKNHHTDHLFEVTLCYTLPIEKFPMSLCWNTMFAGADYFGTDGKRTYSSYIEISYPFKIEDISLEASIAATPWKGIYADDFAVVNIALKAEKTIKISDSFSLPMFGQIISNPRNEDIFFVAGIRF